MPCLLTSCMLFYSIELQEVSLVNSYHWSNTVGDPLSLLCQQAGGDDDSSFDLVVYIELVRCHTDMQVGNIGLTCPWFMMHMTICVCQCLRFPGNHAPGNGTQWRVQACEGMRHMWCVGFTFKLCLWYTILQPHEPSNLYATYTKQVGSGGLALLDVLFASSK